MGHADAGMATPSKPPRSSSRGVPRAAAAAGVTWRRRSRVRQRQQPLSQPVVLGRGGEEARVGGGEGAGGRGGEAFPA